MTGRTLAIIGALVAGLLLLCTGGIGAVLPSVTTQDTCSAPDPPADSAVTLTIDDLATDQRHNATTIINVGQQLHVPPRGWIIALATALQESLLHNSTAVTDHDSVGLFQQRPSSGWGDTPAAPGDTRTPAQRLADPRYAATRFYDKLLRIPDWETRRLADIAQTVQISAFPERYARWESVATLLAVHLTQDTTTTSAHDAAGVLATDETTMRCAAPGQVSAAGWTVPVRGPIGSGFRTPQRPGHAGVDLLVARFTVIHAASAGIVITAACNASTGNCDIDGNPQVKGCGWYVELAHTTGLTTRYCHMVERPAVTVGQTVVAGQPLGKVGSSGNSSGPHLHFETHVNGQARDPVPFMAARGAPLGANEP
ncbi:M23 family metallopeptidase [Cryptosporangium phraense]|uniref:M23 family metallopeptidase n=1 Tax=Cryptosporangium phraense TaxID=2593070 RepID=A0A545ANM2_9ACTN|nr:M23 family metallopeptidase [Cryptosporangium phraense]